MSDQANKLPDRWTAEGAVPASKITPDMSGADELKAAYGMSPPPPGTADADAWTRLGLQPPVRTK